MIVVLSLLCILEDDIVTQHKQIVILLTGLNTMFKQKSMQNHCFFAVIFNNIFFDAAKFISFCHLKMVNNSYPCMLCYLLNDKRGSTALYDYFLLFLNLVRTIIVV